MVILQVYKQNLACIYTAFKGATFLGLLSMYKTWGGGV